MCNNIITTIAKQTISGGIDLSLLIKRRSTINPTKELLHMLIKRNKQDARRLKLTHFKNIFRIFLKYFSAIRHSCEARRFEFRINFVVKNYQNSVLKLNCQITKNYEKIKNTSRAS